MSSIRAISDGQGGYIYPVTIANAIIDPETGEPVTLGGGSTMEYTVNEQHADSDGNFTITNTMVGAAAAEHTHTISDVSGLQTALDGKSGTSHTHAMVTGIVVNGSTATGSVVLAGTGNVRISQSGSSIAIAITPYTTDTSDRLTDSNSSNTVPVNIFTGTQEEWDAFKANMANNKRYIVFIRS